MQLFKRNSKQPNYASIKFGGNIWKIIPDTHKSMLFIELREPEIRQVKFYAVDAKKCKIIWEYKDSEEKWWLGLEDSLPDAVLIHGYRNPKFPEHKGIVALNPNTGNILWRNSSWVYVSISNSNLLVTTAEVDDEALVVDSKKGDILNRISSSTTLESDKPKKTNIASGQQIMQDGEVYNKVKTFISNQLALDIINEVTYLEYHDHLIISFYTLDVENNIPSTDSSSSDGEIHNNPLLQMLWIVDKEGNQKILKTIGKNLKGISSDPFFVFENMVIFLIEKNELVIYGFE